MDISKLATKLTTEVARTYQGAGWCDDYVSLDAETGNVEVAYLDNQGHFPSRKVVELSVWYCVSNFPREALDLLQFLRTCDSWSRVSSGDAEVVQRVVGFFSEAALQKAEEDSYEEEDEDEEEADDETSPTTPRMR